MTSRRTPSARWPSGASPTPPSTATPPDAQEARGDTTPRATPTSSWTRLTRWRGLLAAALDQPPYEPVTGAVVGGAPDSPSTDLLAAWLAPAQGAGAPRRDPARVGHQLGATRPQERADRPRAPGRRRRDALAAGQPDRRITLPRRSCTECLADELRRLDPDDTYEDALLLGLEALTPCASRLPRPLAPARRPTRPVTPAGRPSAARRLREGAIAMITAPRLRTPRDGAGARRHGRKLAGKPTPARRRPPEGRPTRATTEGRQTAQEQRDQARPEGRVMTAEPVVIVHPDKQSLADAAAARLVTALLDAQTRPDEAQIALTGGRWARHHRLVDPVRGAPRSTGRGCASGGATSATCPPVTPSRNDTQNDEAGLTDLGLDPAKVHRVAGPDASESAEASAAAYAATIREHGHGDFDVVVLGVGPDGHVASLFPHHAAQRVTDAIAVAVHDSPKPPPDRVSLTFECLDRSRARSGSSSPERTRPSRRGRARPRAPTAGTCRPPRRRAPRRPSG